MTTQRGGPPAVDPSSATIRQLLGAAQRELDGLRAELDTRLAALEAALARPDQRSTLEERLMALARVATAEAEAATARALLAARVESQERADAAATELQRALDAERAATQAARQKLA